MWERVNIKRILLINQGHTGNLGDIAINQVITELLKGSCVVSQKFEIQHDEAFFKYRTTKIKNKLLKKAVSLYNAKVVLLYKVVKNDYKNKALIKKYLKENEYDFAIIGGGELLGSHLGFNSVLKVWTRELEKKKIPVAVFGVSGNANMTKFFLSRNRKALRKCKYINVRDYTTAKIFEEGYNVRATVSPDIVFLYRELYENTSAYYEKGNSIVCMVLNYNMAKHIYGDKNAYFEFWLRMIKKARKSNEKVYLSYTTKEDKVSSYEFYEYLLIKEVDFSVDLVETESIEDMIELFKRSKVVITGRMHAMIFALQYGNEIIPFEFKQKISVFKEEWIDKPFNHDETKKRILQEINNMLTAMES